MTDTMTDPGDEPEPTKPEAEADLAAEARKMLARLIDACRLYRRDINRARGLVLFEERKPLNGSKAIRAKSRVGWNDTPQFELLLKHRDDVVAIDRDLEVARAQLAVVGSGDHLAEVLGNLARLEAAGQKHLQAIQDILAAMTKEWGAREVLMAKMASDGSRLAQAATEHTDKMALAAKSDAIPSTAELKQRLAAKYGVPVEDVERILDERRLDRN